MDGKSAMKAGMLFGFAVAAAMGGGAVYWVMSRGESETMEPSVDVKKIGTHSLMPEHEGGVEDAWMDPGHREDHARVEQSLFFSESKLYTKADMAANGPKTPAEKYKGEMSRHDFRPKSGDLVCPITNTKANPKFTWTINGKLYTFCCPPCIEEFVRIAKDEPDRIKPPETYVKK
jgi:YHS domain-containing protein